MPHRRLLRRGGKHCYSQDPIVNAVTAIPDAGKEGVSENLFVRVYILRDLRREHTAKSMSQLWRGAGREAAATGGEVADVSSVG